MRIIAIDPGGTTGYVEVEASSDNFTLTKVTEISWSRRFSLKEHLLLGPPPKAVVVESFRLYASKAEDQINSEFPSVRIIGALEAFLFDLGWIDRLVFQPASIRSRVKILDEHREVRKSPHTHDAYQHARYYFVTKVKNK